MFPPNMVALDQEILEIHGKHVGLCSIAGCCYRPETATCPANIMVCNRYAALDQTERSFACEAGQGS